MIKLRIILVFIGLLTVMGGLLPILKQYNILQEYLGFIPVTGPIYQGIIIAIGVFAILYGLKTHGTYRFFRGWH